MTHPSEEYVNQVFDMMTSLQKAIKDAGGSVIVTPDYLERTTVKELILLLASNGVRFSYVGPPKAAQPLPSHQLVPHTLMGKEIPHSLTRKKT